MADRVSVVITAYNAADYVAEAIESALSQTHPEIEVVVVDDGSTDGTREVLRPFEQRVKVVRQRNGGTASARNAGARIATGSGIVFLDADDRLDPRFVELCLGHLQAHPAAAYVYTQFRYFGDQEGLSHFPEFSESQLVQANFISASTLIPRELVVRHPFRESEHALEDWDFYVTLLREGATGVLLDLPLLEYRRHPSSKQATAGRIGLVMPLARARIHFRHRDLLGSSALPTLAADIRDIARALVPALRTWLSLRLRALLRL